MMTLRTETEEAMDWLREEGGSSSVVEACSYQTYPGSEQHLEPPEYCENDAVPGEEFCILHTEGLFEGHEEDCFDQDHYE